MHLLIAIAIAALATWGLKTLVNRMTAAGQQRYAAARTRLAGWRAAQAQQPAPPPSPLAIRLGTVAGGVAQGAVLAWGAGAPGWRLGWAQGRQHVRDWWERRQATEPEPLPEPDPPAAAPVDTAPDPEAPPQPTSPPILRVITNPNPQPAGGAVPVIETIGEVNTVADVRAGVQAVIVQYTAELDDAQAEAARKKASYDAAVNLADQSTTVLDNDANSRSAVAGLVEPARQAWLGAQARAANADLMLGQAQTALAALNAHRGMEEAAAATPQANSDTRTYQPQ